MQKLNGSCVGGTNSLTGPIELVGQLSAKIDHFAIKASNLVGRLTKGV